MTVEEAVVDRLLASSDVTDLVSTRITQLVVPQGSTYPAIRVQKVDEPRQYHLRGKDHLTAARIQVDIYTRPGAMDAYLSAATIGSAVEESLTVEGWSVGSPSRHAVTAFLLDERPVYEAEEFQLVRIMQEYRVWSQEA